MNPQSRLAALAAVAPVTWGTTYVVTTELLPPDRPMTAAVLRALPAGLLLLAVTREALPREWWSRVAVLGVLNIGAFFPLLFLAAYRLPGSVAAVVGALGPFVAAGMSVAMGTGRPSRGQLGWALAAVLGVALTTVGSAYRLDALGIAAAVGGAVVMSAGVVLTRHWGQPSEVSGLALTGWQLVIGGLVVLPLVGPLDSGPMYVDGPALVGYAWLALVGTALAYSLWFRAARVLPPFGMSMLTRLSPVTAAGVGWALLGETLTPWQVGGFALALLASVRAQDGARPPVRRVVRRRQAVASTAC